MSFQLLSESSSARTGFLKTAHGKIKTPFFMPVATKGSVKNINNFQLRSLGFDCIISNSFINYLKPGLEIISGAGGMHSFFGWDKSIFTDSGGFQLLSPDFLDFVNDSGVSFKNPFTGLKEFITPEKAIGIQNSFGSDVAMCLDHVIPIEGPSRLEHFDAMIRTVDWAYRCKQSHSNPKQLLFGIIQGGTHLDLRKKCVLALNKIGFDGLAIGGLCIGERASTMYSITKYSKKFIPKEKICYLMGVGSPIELINSVELGVDCFDSVFPMRMARHGRIFTHDGEIIISRGKFARDYSSLDDKCDCFVCKNHSRSFLHHLYKTREQNAHVLLTYHNIYFISKLMSDIRTSINENNFSSFKKSFSNSYSKK